MSPVEPIARSASALDLSPRFVAYKTVDASPSAATETVIATLTIPNMGGLAVVSGVILNGWAAYTVGTSGTAVNLRIRQTGTSGTVVAATGAMTKTAGNLYADDVAGFDTSPLAAGVYVLTMTVTSGAAASTVSALLLTAFVV